MKKNILNIFFVLMIFAATFFLFGCQHDRIQFYRESKVTSVIKQISGEEKKPTVKKSSGVIIYKDTSNSSATPINFGPRDLIFDLPSKFK